MNTLPKSMLLSLLLGFGTMSAANGQGSMAIAQLSSQALGGGLYSHVISLNNTGETTIGTFWYAWVPGADFLPTMPTSVQSPDGWVSYIAGGGSIYYPDGYSIEWVAMNMLLDPGGSLDFGFTSMDSPGALAGNSPFYPGTPVGTSYTYSGGPFSDVGYQFTVEPVPEPSSLGLLLAGCLGVLLLGWLRTSPKMQASLIRHRFSHR